MNETIPLSSIDYIFTGTGSYPIEFIFSYDGFLDGKKLKSSLEETIKYFQPVASILVNEPEDIYAFKLSKEGLVFDVVRSEINFNENDKKYKYINPVDTREGNPLSKIRITHTPKGSVLGVSISHAVGDGFSYFHFLSSWARIFHGKPILPPVHQRNLLISKQNYASGKLSKEDVFKNSGLFWEGKRSVIVKKNLKWESRIFSHEELKDLVSMAQNETEVRLSFNDIITAQLSKELLPKWDRSDTEYNYYISCPVDFRRLMDGFPKTYFGNAITFASTVIDKKKLKELSLCELALKIRSNVKKVNQEAINYYVKTLSTISSQQKPSVFENIHAMHPDSGLLVTNLSRLPVQEITFNTGPPIDYNILTQTIRGAVILPHKEGIEARVCSPVN
jgi:shikimate O-hydroxycinnamoyltransferase